MAEGEGVVMDEAEMIARLRDEIDRAADNSVGVVELHAGDRVLITLRDGVGMSRQYVAELTARLQERFPGVAFTFLGGVESLHIQRGTP